MLFNKRPVNNGTLLPGRSLAPEHGLANFHKPTPVPSQSRIDASLTIVGDLRTDGDVQVDGQVCGDIRCAQLIVGPDATITGDVRAEEAVVRGRVKGTIRATRIILQDSARVESDIFYGRLTVDEGASFDGHSHRCEDPLHDAEQAAAQPEAMVVELEAADMLDRVANGSGEHSAGA